MPTNWCLLRVHNNKGGAKMNRLLRVFAWGACYPPFKISPNCFITSNIRRLVYKQLLKNNNLGSFLPYWKGQKRTTNLAEKKDTFLKTAKLYLHFYKDLSLRIIKVKGAKNYVRRKGAYSKSPQMGYGHYEGKGLVCSLLGDRVRSWSFNTSTIY